MEKHPTDADADADTRVSGYLSTPAPVRTYIVMTINCHWSFFAGEMESEMELAT